MNFRGVNCIGVGAGQMSRVDSSRIAVWKAGEAARLLGRPNAERAVAGSSRRGCAAVTNNWAEAVPTGR